MKNKNLPRNILLVAALASVLSFMYVNTNSGISLSQAAQTSELLQEKIEEEKDSKDIPMPDATLLAKLVDLASKVITALN